VCRHVVMHDFVKFFGAVAAGWVFLMSGIASVGVAVWLRIRRRSDIATAPFWVIAAICLLFAFFLAWRSERRGRIAAESTVQEMATPHLEGSIEMIDVGHIKSTDELQSVVLIWLGVRNQGADSIAVRISSADHGWRKRDRAVAALEDFAEHPFRRFRSHVTSRSRQRLHL